MVARNTDTGSKENILKNYCLYTIQSKSTLFANGGGIFYKNN